ADQGTTWEVQKTGQALPINGLYFLDEKTGWAVGEFGTVLTTIDGGETWKSQRHGGQRAAVVFLKARGAGGPVGGLAVLGGEEGYLTATLRVVGPDPASAAPIRSIDAQRLESAIRMAGGASGEMFWQFPVPQHLGRSAPMDLVKSWDRLHADHAAQEWLRQLVFSIRSWQSS